jgi:cell division septal protein FtsQ
MSGWLRALLLVVTLVGIVLALWLTLDGRFYVYDASIVGAEGVLRESVLKASRLPGIHILWVRSSEAASYIVAENPSVKSATVRCRLPADCTIAVVQRQPRIVWEEEGQVWSIDEEGVATRVDGPLPEGWYVRGELPLTDGDILAERVRIGLEELSAADLDMSRVFYYTADLGLVFIDRRGWRVAVGDGTGMAARLDRLEWMAGELLADGVMPELVDVRFSDVLYYTEAEG